MWRDAPNINALWGSLIVEELVRTGVDEFVVTPGSRSTPLVQAVARHPEANATIWLDERGAAFHALGRGRAGSPAAVVTTSGTAVANLLPAVVEASLDGVPLILLTADRPPELREVGANQSIRQMGIFSDHVRWAFDLPVPDDRTPARMVLTTVDHLVHRAVSAPEGPTQLNCPFREPLAPAPEPWDANCLNGLETWESGQTAFTVVEGAGTAPYADAELDVLARELAAVDDGLLVLADRRLMRGYALAGVLGWPVWADVRSGVRLGMQDPPLTPHVDRLLGTRYEPQVILQVGRRVTSKRVQRYLDSGAAKRYIVVDDDPTRIDPGHRVTDRFACEAETWCDLLDDALDELEVTKPVPDDIREVDRGIEATIEAAVEAGGQLSEPWVARWLSRNVAADHGLFLSNSMPIRDVQDYGARDGPEVKVGANRGASGIDGVISTAAGFAQGLGMPTTLLIGDVALIHDINALAMLGQLEHPLTTVVLNNGGGSIFSFLPIAEHEDVLDPYVSTPHAISFEGVCKDFDLPYVRVETREAFERAYEEGVASGEHTLIEVASSLECNRAEHERIEAYVEAEIAKALS